MSSDGGDSSTAGDSPADGADGPDAAGTDSGRAMTSTEAARSLYAGSAGDQRLATAATADDAPAVDAPMTEADAPRTLPRLPDLAPDAARESDTPGAPDAPPEPEHPAARTEISVRGDREPNDLGETGAVEPGPERNRIVRTRVDSRLAVLDDAEKGAVERLAVDPDRGRADVSTRLEALDAGALQRTGVLPPGELRRPNPKDPAEAGSDVIDATDQKWDHKLAWSGEDWDPEEFTTNLRKDLSKGENIILNHEQLNQRDFRSLVEVIHDRGIADRVVFYPPLR